MPSVSDFAVESDVWPHIASPGQGLQGGSRLISSAKLLQSFLALDFIANYCDLLRLSERKMAQTHVYHTEMQRIAPRKTIFRTAHL